MQRFENKFDLLKAAHEDGNLKKGTISLLQYLVYKSNQSKCFPAVETIARALGCCVRTVQYNMRKLERAGYIVRKDRWYNHQQLSNQYEFNFGAVEVVSIPCEETSVQEKTGSEPEFNMPEDTCKTIRKMKEMQKVYEMHLKAAEKLLLAYLYYKANQKGVYYGSGKSIMEAVGMRNASMSQTIKSLREKGLLRIKQVKHRCQKILIIQLTGAVYSGTCSEEKGQSVNIVQTSTKDHRLKNRKSIQTVHFSAKHKKQKFTRLCQRMKRSFRHIRLFLYHKRKKWVSVLKKIREILRI